MSAISEYWSVISNLQKASVVTAILGFIIGNAQSRSVDGVQVMYRDNAALVFGVATILLGVISIPGTLRSTKYRNQQFTVVVIAIIIGAIHIGRGFGMFA